MRARRTPGRESSALPGPIYAEGDRGDEIGVGRAASGEHLPPRGDVTLVSHRVRRGRTSRTNGSPVSGRLMIAWLRTAAVGETRCRRKRSAGKDL